MREVGYSFQAGERAASDERVWTYVCRGRGIGIRNSKEQKSGITVEANDNREEERKKRERESFKRNGEMTTDCLPLRHTVALGLNAQSASFSPQKGEHTRITLPARLQQLNYNLGRIWAPSLCYSIHTCSPAARMPPVLESHPLPGSP